jgi:dihydrofolate synthase/folylpolyglutamate synthase
LFDSLQEAFLYLEAFTNLEKKPKPFIREYRLDRMKALLSAFGNPHDHPMIFHIAGSKGKGSTGIFLTKLLEGRGHKVGLYTSPHVLSYTERITLGGEACPDKVYLRNINRIHTFLQNSRPFTDLPSTISQEPTTFELLTLLAFLIFEELKVDAIVLETGLGGRLDATNLVQPLATIITPIELEHTAILGNSLASIAGEKAGIIKPQIPLFLSPQAPEAWEVFRSVSLELQAPFYPLEEFSWRLGPWDFHQGWIESRQQRIKLNLGMAGKFQAQNFLLALYCYLHFFPDASSKIWQEAAASARLPGRMEVMSSKPWIILDGGHTPKAMTKLMETIDDLTSPPKTLVFGAVADKDIEGMASVLVPHFHHIFLTRAGVFRSSDLEAMEETFRRAGARELQSFEEPHLILGYLNERPEVRDRGLLITGSFFLLGEIQPWL